jgi:hypothetical protein
MILQRIAKAFVAGGGEKQEADSDLLRAFYLFLFSHGC